MLDVNVATLKRQGKAIDQAELDRLSEELRDAVRSRDRHPLRRRPALDRRDHRAGPNPRGPDPGLRRRDPRPRSGADHDGGVSGLSGFFVSMRRPETLQDQATKVAQAVVQGDVEMIRNLDSSGTDEDAARWFDSVRTRCGSLRQQYGVRRYSADEAAPGHRGMGVVLLKEDETDRLAFRSESQTLGPAHQPS